MLLKFCRLVLLSLAAIGSANAQPAELVLSTCKRLPTFDAQAVRYLNRGAGLYGSWFYELVLREVRTVMLLDGFDRPYCGQSVDISEWKTMLFEINEADGDAADVARDVRAWLAGHAIEQCP